jgi:hypothetical protein
VPFPNPDTQFQPGESGNPKGRPSGSLGDRLRAVLAGPTKDGQTVGDKLIEAAVKHAAKGDFRFFKEIWDRHDGKIPDPVPEAPTAAEQPRRIIIPGADERPKPIDPG